MDVSNGRGKEPCLGWEGGNASEWMAKIFREVWATPKRKTD